MNKRDSLLGTVITRKIGSSGQTGTCPPPEEIAALADGSIGGAERDRLLRHLAECGKCRRVFVTVRELVDDETAGGTGRRLSPPLLAAAAAIVVVLTLALTIRESTTDRIRVAQREEGRPAGHRSAPEAAKPPGSDRKSPFPSPAPEATVPPPTDGPAAQAPLVLLSAREAAMPGSRSFGFATNPQQDGPGITVENLEMEEGKPFPLSVGFIPKEGSPVNIATLKLECLKISPIDLTARVRPYAGGDGVSIDRVSLPAGSYRFRVSIGDVNGRFSEKEFSVNVSGTF